MRLYIEAIRVRVEVELGELEVNHIEFVNRTEEKMRISTDFCGGNKGKRR